MQSNSQYMLRRFSMKYEAPICEMMQINNEDIIRTSTTLVPITPKSTLGADNQTLDLEL